MSSKDEENHWCSRNISIMLPFSLNDWLNQYIILFRLPGIYTWLFETFSGNDGKPPGFFMKAALGMTAGASGAFVGTPAEVTFY